MELPRKFRKLSVRERRGWIHRLLEQKEAPWDGIPTDSNLIDLADLLIESAIGIMPVPMGIVREMIVNGKTYIVPMAIEEPSVIAAANFGAGIINRSGGITAEAAESVMTAQIFLENPPPNFEDILKKKEGEMRDFLDTQLTSMKKRGGGFKDLEWKPLKMLNLLRFHIKIDVQDAFGANRLNTTAEAFKDYLENLSSRKALMSVLSNAATDRITRASFSIPIKGLDRGGFTGQEAAHRISLASKVAQADFHRAVTHNKGIMNGITALTLATGNDTRAIEAAAHAYAARSGQYRGLTTFIVEENFLKGEIELPLTLATVGGSVTSHPVCQKALALMGNPCSRKLCEIGAGLGLIQNFTALYALVTEGIQKGHMRLHNKRK